MVAVTMISVKAAVHTRVVSHTGADQPHKQGYLENCAHTKFCPCSVNVALKDSFIAVHCKLVDVVAYKEW